MSCDVFFHNMLLRRGDISSIYNSLMNSDMVALPVVDMRTSGNGQIGSALSHTRTKLVPRKGVTDAWHELGARVRQHTANLAVT